MGVADLDGNGRAEVYQDGHGGLTALEWDGSRYRILAAARLAVMLDRVMIAPSPVQPGKQTIIVEDKEGTLALLRWDGQNIQRRLYPAVGFNSCHGQTADLNADGRLELIYGDPTNGGAPLISALTFNQDRFEPFTQCNPLVEPLRLAAGDLNHNGRPEIFGGCRDGLVVLEWDGGGLRELTANCTLGPRVYEADIDGNGKGELVSQLYGGGLSIWNWRRSELMWQGFLQENRLDQELAWLAGAGDLNADGRDEVLFWNPDQKSITCYHWQDGLPVRLAELTGFVDFSRLLVADLDGAGCEELVVGDAQKGVTVFSWDNGVLREKWRFQEAAGYTFLAVGALTGAPYPELLVGINSIAAESDYGMGRLYALRWNGEDYRGIWRSPRLPRGCSELHVADVAGDQRPDILTRTPWTSGTEIQRDDHPSKQPVYYWDGSTFKMEECKRLSGYVLAAGDLNKDGEPELLVFQHKGSGLDAVEETDVDLRLLQRNGHGYDCIWSITGAVQKVQMNSLPGKGSGVIILWLEDQAVKIYTLAGN